MFACAGKTELFFSGDLDDIERAQRLCDGCPHQEPCAEAGEGLPFGVWGGRSASDRGFYPGTLRRRKPSRSKNLIAS